jgi:hypothetical protein
MLVISILSFIGFVLSFNENSRKNKVNVNFIFPAILATSLWESHLALAITVMIFTLMIIVVKIVTRE